MKPEAPNRGLGALARAYGVQTSFYDVFGQRHAATPDSLVAILRSLGAPIMDGRDVREALQSRRRRMWERALEPVAVATAGQEAEIRIRWPQDGPEVLAAQLQLEGGEKLTWQESRSDEAVRGSTTIDGRKYDLHNLTLPAALPAGYHELSLEAGEAAWTSRIICAPPRCYEPDEAAREWGVFLPLYALRTRRQAAVADFGSLQALATWTARHGGRYVATLPLHAAFLDEPFEVSPYAPVSRLFWNELYVDSSAASAASGDGVPYRDHYAAQRERIGEIAASLDRDDADYKNFAASSYDLPSYVAFRATAERERRPWREWPARQRGGDLQPGDYDEAAAGFHTCAQYLAARQLEGVADSLHQAGQRLYLDYPLGVHPDGYDTWRYRDQFATDASAGAPPDAVFTRGQDWGFHPLKPEAMRADGYGYLIRSLRQDLKLADVLRVDHIMGLHRLYWISAGLAPDEGAYVRYPHEELYAILRLESHRQKALILGEDLGTVPTYVRRAMAKYGVRRSYVVQYEMSPDQRRPLTRVPKEAVASVNTHDMPPFAGFWRNRDLEDEPGADPGGARRVAAELRSRGELKTAVCGYLQARGLLREAAVQTDVAAVYTALLQHLGESAAETVLVNLEDLWQEEAPQNVPGTSAERPNWRRQARFTLEETEERPEIASILACLDSARRTGLGV